MSKAQVCLGVLLAGAAVSMVGCIAPGENVPEKQANIQKMKDKTLPEFYTDKPELRGMLTKAAGYAIFKGFEAGIIPGGGAGYGVLVDNATGQQTYMQWGQGTIGIGLTVKSSHTLLVFDDAKTLAEFKSEEWVSGGSAEAVFNFGEFGGQTNATGYFTGGVRVYELTDGGVSLRAWVPVRKYSPYNKLNPPKSAQ